MRLGPVEFNIVRIRARVRELAGVAEAPRLATGLEMAIAAGSEARGRHRMRDPGEHNDV